MPDQPPSKWPPVRVNPAIQDTLKALLAEAHDGTPLVQVINAILSEAVSQISAPTTPIGPIATVQRLRSMTHRDSAPGDLKAIVDRLEQGQRNIEEQLAEIVGRLNDTEPSLRVAEDDSEAKPKRRR